jgi:hypothetical protein
MKAHAFLAALAMAMAMAAAPMPAAAQAAKAPPAPSKVQLEKAALRLRVLMSALQSDKVEQPVKNALFSCIYSNSMAKISDGMDKAIAANKQVKVDTANPTQLLGVMAAVCGYRPAKPATPTR